MLLRKARVSFKIVTFFLSLSLVFSGLAYYIFSLNDKSYADIVNQPVFGLSLPKQFNLDAKQNNVIYVKGISFDQQDPLKLNFFFDGASQGKFENKDLHRLIKYFLGFLAISQDKLWVNLSPYEKDRILPDVLAELDLGKDMLIEDYLLKQLSSTLTNPAIPYGKKFWNRVYKMAEDIAGTKNVPIDTCYKVWVVPDIAEIYEYSVGAGSKPALNKQNKTVVFVKNAKLKVMMETDYHNNVKQQGKGLISPVPDRHILRTQGSTSAKIQQINNQAKEIFKQELLPIIEEQVNKSISFAPLRQLYYSLILATYFKKQLARNPFYSYYINQEKVAPIELVNGSQAREKVYQTYLDNLRAGVFNYLKKEYDSLSRKQVNRQYFSGGLQFFSLPGLKNVKINNARSDLIEKESSLVVKVMLTPILKETKQLGEKLHFSEKFSRQWLAPLEETGVILAMLWTVVDFFGSIKNTFQYLREHGIYALIVRDGKIVRQAEWWAKQIGRIISYVFVSRVPVLAAYFLVPMYFPYISASLFMKILVVTAVINAVVFTVGHQEGERFTGLKAGLFLNFSALGLAHGSTLFGKHFLELLFSMMDLTYQINIFTQSLAIVFTLKMLHWVYTYKILKKEAVVQEKERKVKLERENKDKLDSILGVDDATREFILPEIDQRSRLRKIWDNFTGKEVRKWKEEAKAQAARKNFHKWQKVAHKKVEEDLAKNGDNSSAKESGETKFSSFGLAGVKQNGGIDFKLNSYLKITRRGDFTPAKNYGLPKEYANYDLTKIEGVGYDFLGITVLGKN